VVEGFVCIGGERRKLPDGPSRYGEVNHAGAPQGSEMANITKGFIRSGERDVNKLLDIRQMRGKKSREGLEGQYVGYHHCNDTGCTGQPSSLSNRDATGVAPTLSRMEIGNEGGGKPSARSYSGTSPHSYTRNNKGSDKTGTNPPSTGGLGGGLADSSTRRRCDQAENEGHTSSSEWNESTFRRWKDRYITAIHRLDSGLVCSDKEVCGEEDVRRRRDRLVVPGSIGNPTEGCSQESRPPPRAEVHKEGGPAVFGVNRNERHTTPGIQPTQVSGYSQEISGVRLVVRGKCGEGEEGSRIRSERKEVVWHRGTPKFITKNFLDPPSWEAIQMAFPLQGGIQRKKWPLNIKKVNPGNIKLLSELDCLDEACREFFNESSRILWDEELYLSKIKDTIPPPFKKPSISAVELQSLVDGKLERAEKTPLWGTFAFKVAEPHKQRCRCIFDCRINDVFKTTPKYTLKTKTQIRAQLNRENIIFLQFDFKSFYDQFVLSYLVRKFFGVLGHDDMFYWLCLLPMGFRLAVACAQAAMWLFLNFERGSVQAATCIDNVCLSGERKTTLGVAHHFLLRVERCGFTLNGFEEKSYTSMSEEDKLKKLESLIESEPEFLGEKYDLFKKTRSMTEKTLGKLILVWEAIGDLLREGRFSFITGRQFFSLIGILVYSTGVLNINTHPFYNLFKKIRKMSGILSKTEAWDDPMPSHLTRDEFGVLEEWIKIVKTNRPVDMVAGVKKAPPLNVLKAELFVILDASKVGWGAVIFDENRKFRKYLQGKWPVGEDYSSSVRAEPQGVIEVIFRLRKEWKGRVVAILTDHENLVHASKALFVHNYFYNRCLARVEAARREMGAEIWMYFLEGKKNNADSISRNKGFFLVDSIFPEVEGTGLGSALMPPQWQT